MLDFVFVVFMLVAFGLGWWLSRQFLTHQHKFLIYRLEMLKEERDRELETIRQHNAEQAQQKYSADQAEEKLKQTLDLVAKAEKRLHDAKAAHQAAKSIVETPTPPRRR